MRYKGLITSLTIVVFSISIYSLSFTLVGKRVDKEAKQYATDKEGHVDFEKKQKFLDEKWNSVVHRQFWTDYTLEEVKERGVGVGLDMQGGMHIVLTIDDIDMFKDLAGSNNRKPIFLDVMAKAKEGHSKQAHIPFLQHFYQAHKELNPQKPLREMFLKSTIRNQIPSNATDEEVLTFIKEYRIEQTKLNKNIFESRLNQFGARDLKVRLTPYGDIEIEAPGATSRSRIQKLLKKTGHLSFYKVSRNQKELDDFKTLLDEYLKRKESTLLSKDLFIPTEGGNLICSSEHQSMVGELLARDEVKMLLSNGLELCMEAKPNEEEGKEYFNIYLIKKNWDGKGELEGNVITNAKVEFYEGEYEITMKMNSSGAKAWRKITGDVAKSNGHIAIVMDGSVLSAFSVEGEIASSVSRLKRNGGFPEEEAKDLANILVSGALSTKVIAIEEAIIGPTLGNEAQAQGIQSVLIGLVIILLFMLLYYALGGLVANLVLGINILFILGALAQIKATLTLSGIAGIGLTIGMAIDMNVLIFERIREELKKGVYIKKAVANGYNKAYGSIIDSNITTLLTGVILFLMGQGPIKGFATTLIIGIISSVFTGFFVSRLIVEFFMHWLGAEKLSFSFGFSKNLLNGFNINFLGVRKAAYLFSTLLIVVGGVLTYKQGGLNYGVDFTGGRTYLVEFDKPIDIEKVKSGLTKAFDNEPTEVSAYGKNSVLRVTTPYLIHKADVATDKKVKSLLIESIKKQTGCTYVANTRTLKKGNFTIARASKVGATLAEDIKQSSLKAILLSLLMIFLYILFRFRKWQFALSAVIALLHDSLVVFAAIAIARAFGVVYEIDLVFTASILTGIGYSINDTVVVFNRIKEMMKKLDTTDLTRVTNRAINETMSRTLITSFTTFVAVLCLFVFGGASLNGFSFSMLISILSGTGSSIFIAAPLASDLSKKS